MPFRYVLMVTNLNQYGVFRQVGQSLTSKTRLSKLRLQSLLLVPELKVPEDFYYIYEEIWHESLEFKMADQGMTLAIVLLVAGLLVGGGIGYFASPSSGGINGGDKTLTIKVTAVSESGTQIILYSGDSSWTFVNNGYNFLPDHTYKIIVNGYDIVSVSKIS
jgi:hypothetical protein